MALCSCCIGTIEESRSLATQFLGLSDGSQEDFAFLHELFRLDEEAPNPATAPERDKYLSELTSL